VRRFHREHPDDHLFFILGADQFLEIPTWKNYESLLDACDFIIASRPGFRLDALRLVIPPEKLGRSTAPDSHKIALRRTEIHLLTTVASHVSSTEVRERLERKQGIHGLVPARVEEYILGQALYR
jgi:nicotinate-nucleotide adenylyltransferase